MALTNDTTSNAVAREALLNDPRLPARAGRGGAAALPRRGDDRAPASRPARALQHSVMHLTALKEPGRTVRHMGSTSRRASGSRLMQFRGRGHQEPKLV